MYKKLLFFLQTFYIRSHSFIYKHQREKPVEMTSYSLMRIAKAATPVCFDGMVSSICAFSPGDGSSL